MTAKSSTRGTDMTLDDVNDVDITLMTLRKPTALKKVIDSVPKPSRAVPKHGLPIWYKLGLECKLPVPKMPAGKIVFSRGKIGEDFRRVGLGTGPQPTFDLTDPYCNNVTFDYVAVHDPHLAHYFAEKPARERMLQIGFCTKDKRAVCTLKEFNQYRKYLYNKFMDRIHMEMNKLDERARDDLTLKKVDRDVIRRQKVFSRAERAREHLELVAKEHADEMEERRRAARQQEKKIQARIQYLHEFNEKKRKERAAKAAEKQNKLKQRVMLAAELELTRTISMVRQWRKSERKRLNRLKQEREDKKRRLEAEANRKWQARVEAQNAKIQEEALLLKVYTDDMAAGAGRRAKKAEVYAYNTDLQLARIRMANLRAIHGGTAKTAKLVKKVGIEFEKSKRGAKGMSYDLAQGLAQEAMAAAFSNRGDALMTLGQARALMDIVVVLPIAPVKILEETLENVVMEFTRRHVNQLVSHVERVVHARAANVFFKDIRPSTSSKRSNEPRYTIDVSEVAENQNEFHRESITFGEIFKIPNPEEAEMDFKSSRDRPPTPVPSLTRLAEVSFSDRLEDLPDPVTIGCDLPERAKLLETVNIAAKLLSKGVSQRVLKGMDLSTHKVTLPYLRHPMEWGEAIEGITEAVVDQRIQPDCPDIRRTCEYLANRILRSLSKEMKQEKQKQKNKILEAFGKAEKAEKNTKPDFYAPEQQQEHNETNGNNERRPS